MNKDCETEMLKPHIELESAEPMLTPCSPRGVSTTTQHQNHVLRLSFEELIRRSEKILVGKIKFPCALNKDQMMNKPVYLIEDESVLYEEETLKQWLSQNDTNPLSGKKLKSKEVKVNTYVLQQIEKYKKKICHKCMDIVEQLYSQGKALDTCVSLLEKSLTLTTDEDEESTHMRVWILESLITLLCRISCSDEDSNAKQLAHRLELFSIYTQHQMFTPLTELAEETLFMDHLYIKVETTNGSVILQAKGSIIEMLIQVYHHIQDFTKWFSWLEHYTEAKDIVKHETFVDLQTKRLAELAKAGQIPSKNLIFSLFYEYPLLPSLSDLTHIIVYSHHSILNAEQYHVLEFCFKRLIKENLARRTTLGDNKKICNIINDYVDLKLKFSSISGFDLKETFETLRQALDIDPKNRRTLENIWKLIPQDNDMTPLFEFFWDKAKRSMNEEELAQRELVRLTKESEDRAIQIQKLERLRTEHSKKIAELETEVVEYKKCIKTTLENQFESIINQHRDKECKVKISIPDLVEKLEKDDEYTSDVILLSDHQWRLKFLVGETNGETTWVDTFLILMKDSAPKENLLYSLTAKFKIDFLSNKRVVNRFCSWKSPELCFNMNKMGYGTDRLISLSDLQKIQTPEKQTVVQLRCTIHDGCWFLSEQQQQDYSSSKWADLGTHHPTVKQFIL